MIRTYFLLLLLSSISSQIKAAEEMMPVADVMAEVVMPVAAEVAMAEAVAEEPVVLVQEAAPAAELPTVTYDLTEAMPAVEAPVTVPMVEPLPVVVPAPAPVVVPAVMPVAQGVPTEDEIVRLVTDYNAYVAAMQHIKTASAVQAPQVDTEILARSLLNLLAIHKKEEALINHLRGSIAALKAMLNTWEDDVDQLLKEKHQVLHHNNQKKPRLEQNKLNKKDKNSAAQRDIDFSIVKDQNNKPKQQK